MRNYKAFFNEPSINIINLGKWHDPRRPGTKYEFHSGRPCWENGKLLFFLMLSSEWKFTSAIN